MSKKIGRPFEYLEYVPHVVEMYVKRKLSIPMIAEITGMARRTVERILISKGVERRPQGNQKGSKRK